MIQNRTIPYGYKREMGIIEINPIESEVVKEIYLDYAKGSSYEKIAEMLTIKHIKYIENKYVWNKNMIARILKNDKYLGKDEYPQIISNDMKLKSNEAVKPYTRTMSREIKVIKPLLVCGYCGQKLDRKSKESTGEKWKCINDKTHIAPKLKDCEILKLVYEIIETRLKNFQFSEKLSQKTSLQIIELENKINIALTSSDINVGEIHMYIKQLAELKYELLENTSHLKEHSRQKLIENPQENLSELKNIIKEIGISQMSVKYLVMKDGTKL